MSPAARDPREHGGNEDGERRAQLAEELTRPGAPFEIEHTVIDGVPLRSFVNAPRNLTEAFLMSRAHDEMTYVVFEQERYTFEEIRNGALALAAEMRRRFGTGKGDRVAVAMRNYPEFVVSFWASVLLGAIFVPLNAWWTGAELSFAISDAGAEVVIADEERQERLSTLQKPLTGVQLVGARARSATDRSAISFAELQGAHPDPSFEMAELEPDDPVTILYTSGTTGTPKGALGTGRATIANIMNMGFGAALEAAVSGRNAGPGVQVGSIAAAPLFHVGGIASMVSGAMFGSKMVLMSKWDAAEGLALAESERVTSLGGVPTIVRQIVDFPSLVDFDLSCVRTFAMGGASVPPDLPLRVFDLFGDRVQSFNGYGLTETTSAVVTNFGRDFLDHPDSVGRTNLTADLRVQDPDGNVLEPGLVGELCFRSPQVVRGYWNNATETARSFVDGWFHSGDLGYVDGDGLVYVVDRLKDVVIRGGENVYCAEVEAVLFEYPGVADVAVVGMPDDMMGERVGAVVAMREGSEIDLESLRAFALRRLAAFKCPETLHVLGELPKTATGKTAKNELRRSLFSERGATGRQHR